MEHKRKKKRTHDDWMSDLPVQEVVHEEENPICEKCGSEMKGIGSNKAYDEADTCYAMDSTHTTRWKGQNAAAAASRMPSGRLR